MKTFLMPCLFGLVAAGPVSALDALDAKTEILATHVTRLEAFRQYHGFYGNPCDLLCVQEYQANRLEILRILQEGSLLREKVKTPETLQRWETLAKRVNNLLLSTQPR